MTVTRVLLLHAYSSVNRGDGLLVDESLAMIREVFGEDTLIDLVTSYPESFKYTGLRCYRSKPSYFGYDLQYLKLLWSAFKTYDLVVGVGGGYLRFGTPVEALKTIIVMGPQLWAAARSRSRTVYLPQSIGPARLGLERPLRFLLSKLDKVWVRDNRSLDEFRDSAVERASDLALLGMQRKVLSYNVGHRPVLSVRAHRGGVPVGARVLANLLGDFDGYVQSAVAGNDDEMAVKSINPARICSFEELIDSPSTARIVVAIRLHAALMAIKAGHYVVHLAYERKGFGAFQDLGLSEFVFNVHDFSPQEVEEIVLKLKSDSDARDDYDSQIRAASDSIARSREQVLGSLAVAGSPQGREVSRW
ncbi:polysaccharide pyruvyl transferase family protein [Paenarthrobacter sp. PAE-2]|uniref:polysaccharide pyruvyl transferase family protein n=1 Tax=Paenarthrobacter sp. PAE-2 TaxID=2982532 RepID=UPI00222EDDEF|nr:polysaccharide pyruvyl transferase family protein [Paenarthrobacter sp. PAE-2]MCW3765183.1 polysaccharide pyruvyl transferase family protein [Paenarthrobacter sp. PAE-2]